VGPTSAHFGCRLESRVGGKFRSRDKIEASIRAPLEIQFRGPPPKKGIGACFGPPAGDAACSVELHIVGYDVFRKSDPRII
jgi:hypothetical protein